MRGKDAKGEHYIVNGQKTWTTLGHYANMIFCLLRTATGVRKQEGISFLLIDMNTPGGDAQKAVLGSLIDGSRLVALAHDEPDSHYALARVAMTRARRSVMGNRGAWTLNGAKAGVQHGEHAQMFLVSTRTSGNDDAKAGITLFLAPTDAAGISVRGYRKIDGGRAAEVMFDNVTLGDDSVFGSVDQGFATLEYAVNCGVLALCAEAVWSGLWRWGLEGDDSRARARANTARLAPAF
ncbi:alkylation response protein AidB-like acyl-CoA dehydrogenase [Paraburkholderia sp. WC7.3g]